MWIGRPILNSNRNDRNARVGEIVLLDFPYTDQVGSKVRPAVIISQSPDRLGDITVAYMTSEVDNYCFDSSAVVIDPTDLESGAIIKRSVIRADKVLVITEKNIKRAGIGRLSHAKIDELLRVQYGAVPVFVDVSLPTYNLDVTQLEAALSKQTKAVMVAHTLGNPFDLAAVKAFCDKHALWLIEDNCDALGSRYFHNGVWSYTGAFGHIGTSSFYPPTTSPWVKAAPSIPMIQS